MEQFIVKIKRGGGVFSESYKFKSETVRQIIYKIFITLYNQIV